MKRHIVFCDICHKEITNFPRLSLNLWQSSDHDIDDAIMLEVCVHHVPSCNGSADICKQCLEEKLYVLLGEK